MSEKRSSAIRELTAWRVKEFLREPEAVFWVFAFPVLLSFALGIAFKNKSPKPVEVAVVGIDAAANLATLQADPGIHAEVMDSATAENELRTGDVAVVVLSGGTRSADTLGVPLGPVMTLRFDSTREESHLARLVVTNALQAGAGRQDVAEIRQQTVTDVGSRYIDFLIPGLLGMNIMGTGMWGVGFAVVKARQGKLLKRFLASPMRKSEYLLSHILARLVFLALEVISVLAFAVLVFHVPVRGSLLALSLIVVLGAMTFSGFGLLVASRAKTIEGVSGLMNVVMVPMWICSGVFFASSNFPDAIQPFIRALPLTALNDALRAVMIDGDSLASVAWLLVIVAVWGVISFGAALKLFRWR